MAIHVVYSVYKRESEDKKSTYHLHDIITHTDTHWVDGCLVSGGIRSQLENTYSHPEYLIKVHEVTSAGNQPE